MVVENKNNITQYFSKWRGCWVYFQNSSGNRYQPNKAELKEYTKFKYKLR